jgi:hypothetical protein
VIGIDFDNTIVRYDELFRQVALEQGLVSPEAATSKTAIRDHLRALGQEDRWTELQGTIYGPRMMDALPFPGAIEFFAACRAAGIPVVIVSHRTRVPYLGERHDLHAAARDWLARHAFHDPAGIGLPVERVFFEETKEAKLARIAEVGCTHFIDDLPELLAHPLFPADVRRILFDPDRQHDAILGIVPASSWGQLATLLLPSPLPLGEAGRRPGEGAGEKAGGSCTLTPALSQRERERGQAPSPQPSSRGRGGENVPSRGGRGREDASASACTGLLTAAGLPTASAIERLPGGGNNRAYRVETAAGPVLLKEYFRHAADPRERLGAEQAFLRFAWDHGVRAIPQPLACDRTAGLALFEFIPGRKLSPGEVTASHVDEAAAFFTDVNRHRHDPDAAALPVASEACFSLAEHLACVDRRMARLATIEPESDLHRRAAALVAERLMPAWQHVRSAVVAGGLPLDAPLAASERVISPSDFGFHNCIATDSGLKFIDFEYAGWDDPAKTVCDFFCQPAVPVPREHLERFLSAVADASHDPAGLRDRVSRLLPVYEIKWCCIMLNEFLPVDDRRRAFARAGEPGEARRAQQLGKVDRCLSQFRVPGRPASATGRNPPP